VKTFPEGKQLFLLHLEVVQFMLGALSVFIYF